MQVSSLLYAMEDEAEDFLKSFRLSHDEQKLYITVGSKFESYFVKKRNTVFEWISFFQRRQEEGESVTSFVNDVHALAKHCNFGALHDEMVKDILLVVIIQLDGNLTPVKAVTCIWRSEMVHQQQVFFVETAQDNSQLLQ